MPAATSTTSNKSPTYSFDRATLGAVLSKIDSSLNADQLGAIIKSVGGDEDAAVKRLLGQVNKLILGGSAEIAESDIEGILKSLEATGKTGKIVSLLGSDSTKLADLANADIGMRYALIQGLPFAITGNDALYDELNRDGSLHKFDPNTGEKRFTDEWFKDRAQFLAVKFKMEGAGKIGVDGTQSWVFEEHTESGTTRLEVNATNATRGAAKMIFAGATTDTQTLVGSANGDRIYSGGGDDAVNAGAGDDYVEGGAGGDLIDGGRGNDTMRGGQGDDQIDGNAGNDKLFGDAGADYLVGGKGDDRMEGGTGFDSYEIESGDGTDTILDADGLGEILLDGQALTGAGTFKDGQYQSDDGRVSYSFAGDLVDGGVLTITVNGLTGADGAATGGMNVIRVVNFKDGDLGIKLNPQAIDGEPLEPTGITGQAFRRMPIYPASQRIDLDSAQELDPRVPQIRVGSDTTNAALVGVAEPAEGSAAIMRQAHQPADSFRNLGLDVGFAGLFSEQETDLALVTGEHFSTALNLRDPGNTILVTDDRPARMKRAAAPIAANDSAIHAQTTHDGGAVVGLLSAQHLQTALLDFHDAIHLGDVLGADHLADASGIGLGLIGVGAVLGTASVGLDQPGLSDSRYSDLNSKKIGVKG